MMLRMSANNPMETMGMRSSNETINNSMKDATTPAF